MRNLIKCLLLFFAPLLLLNSGAIAGQPPSITIIATFDYPDAAKNTFTYGIDENGDVAGFTQHTFTTSHGFVRTHNGLFTAPIIEPDDAGFTQATAVNDARTVAGLFFDAVGTLHGFFRSGGIYTQYDFPGLDMTAIYGLNKAGDFCGSAGNNTTHITQAFVNLAGVSSLIDVPAGSYVSEAYGINDAGQAVGYYRNPDTHGFLREADGSVIAPLDYAGGFGTMPHGINTQGIIVGEYSDGRYSQAYVERLPGSFISYSYPGAILTVFSGINNRNMIAGFYIAHSLRFHAQGFIAQLQ